MNKESLSSPIKLFHYFLRPYYGVLLFVTFLYTVGAMCDVLIPWYISKIINLINATSDKSVVYETFLSLFIKLFALTVASALFNLAYWLILHSHCIYPASTSVRHQLFNLMLKKKPSFWNKNTAGEVWEKVDLTRRTIAASSSIGNFFACCYGSICAILIMCYLVYRIYPPLMIIFLLAGIFIVFLFNRISNNVKKPSQQLAKFQALTKGKIVNLIANFFLLKTFGTEKREQHRLAKDAEKQAKALQKINWTEHLNHFSLQLITLIFECVVLIYAVYLWSKQIIKVGDIVFVLTISSEFYIHLSNFNWSIGFFKSRNAILKKNLQTFNVSSDFEDTPHAKKLKCTKGLIEIKNLNFAYQDKMVLRDINLTIKPREKIGVIGLSGGGKTTLLHLLQRLVNTPKGSIFIDGQDITTVTEESLRKVMAFIPQDTSLFHRTVMENIKYGTFNATDKKAKSAAKNAFADVFIDSFLKGYKTLVGDKGIKLSGGERQRIGIARAILKDAPILLLDEATSALDSQSETYIQQAIEKIIHDKTVIVVAHRLSTLKNMDRIVVIDNGQIVESGTPRRILKQYGKFAYLWNLQKE